MPASAAHQTALDRAHLALANGQYREAHQLAMELLKSDPQLAEAYFIMALIAHRHGNVAKAVDVVERALGFDGENLDYLLFQAQCLLELNRHEQAKVLVGAMEGRELATAHQNDTMGVLESRLGRHDRALGYFHRACARKPDDASFQYNLASSLQFCGRFPEAEAAYEAAIALQRDHYRSHSSLSQLRRQTPERNHLQRLLSLWDESAHDVEARLHLGHALAKEYEDLGDYQRAMHYLVEAKRGKHAQLGGGERVDAELFAAAGDLATELAPYDTVGFESREPIFIVGMPRTGTTLVERILSSHSQVDSAGELANFSLLVKQQLQTASRWVLDAETLRRADRLDFERLGREYIDSTRHLTGGSDRFIDKMPLNFLYVPLIARALPGATIICLRRNPLDTCLSNFRQLFSTGFSYYNYAYSLQDTAEYYACFHRLMEQFTEALGDRVYPLRYEELVENPEGECRRLFLHCGLPWEPGCLEFQRNRSPVATASAVQVREGIYSRAVERWRHYEPWLGDVMRILDAHGIAWRQAEPAGRGRETGR